ncbi:WD40 repeat-like protein [Rhizoctonia solani]|uniref:Pre-rRNA-processing protein IPI3 n=1 Tax=Rhizoctonia solani TaxID=456999 RepID=A0A8H7IHJ6_9AGAM|nr:WD40 repeat-like protein [Rhizoctonia solani]
MRLQETLLCALGPLSGSGAGHLALHDLKTGTTLATYKQNTSAVHNVSVVESQNGQGGYIISAQTDKPILNVYHFQKDQLAQRLVIPERVTCIASDSRGNYCAAGTANGRIYLWEARYLAYFSIIKIFDNPSRERIQVLKFTTDDAAIVSASDDSGVSVWSVASTPSHPLIGTFTFPYAMQMAAMDRAQRVIFAASAAGHVHRINLFKPDDNRRGMEAVTGDTRPSEAEITVGQPITSLCISFTSTYLLVGTASGSILIYDLESHQLLRTIATHKDKGLAIIYLQCMLKPIDHDTREKDPIPLKPVVPFQRTRDLKARETHQVMVMIPPRVEEAHTNSDSDELLAGQAYFLNPQSQSRRGGSGSNSRVTELEEEVAQLRAALGQAKGINDSMWETMVNTLLPKSNPTPNETAGVDYMAVDPSPAGRKRARKTN